MRIQDNELTLISEISHGFFTRKDGVSSSHFSSLNVGLGSSDDREKILENRARIADQLNIRPENLATPYQTHSATAVIVDKVWPPGGGPKADAVVTNRPGVAVGVVTADCGPVLFVDPQNGVVAAAHAGWKGAQGGILEAAVEKMLALGAKRQSIEAVLGPLISQQSYEVGPEFIDRFTAISTGNTQYFIPAAKENHAMFDLQGYIVDRLMLSGIGKATAVDMCTYRNEKQFFSYRRATHYNEPDYGRQLSAILWK